MNYIYDILLNFKEEYYDFYDWNKNDNIVHIRKIPILKIDTIDLYNIKNNKIKIELKFLEKIRNKTEIFTSKTVKNIEYAFLLSDGKKVLAILKQDKKIKKSSLLIDEEMDVLEEIEREEMTKIEYKIVDKEETKELKTRKQNEIEKFVKKELEKIKNQDEKLKYIYYECFNKKEKSKEKILIELNNINNHIINEKLYKFFKLIEVKK
ncbi:MAG: DUF3603 family protein [Bacilli bacterium]|nr:DUF3603 family protein [Bacilli bacterium]